MRERERKKRGERERERHRRWRLDWDDRGYCIVFSFGTNDLPCFPLYCRELLQPPQKHVRGCKSHRATTAGRSGGKRRGGGRRANRTIWEVLHIYGLLVRARKQISGKSWSEITLEPLGRKAAPFSRRQISAGSPSPEYYFPRSPSWVCTIFAAPRRRIFGGARDVLKPPAREGS